MIELILELPIEGQAIVLGSFAVIVIAALKTKKPEDHLNPFEQSTRLSGKEIKQLQEVDKNDR